MKKSDSQNFAWRKSSYSNSNSNCVEVADGFSGAVPVRDSKDPNGPALTFSPEGWSAFVMAIKQDEFPAF